ncbi:DnaJ domain-containing protein [Toxoplasma gondii ME49]|uniref:DnaJ domain-containing protein n=2 Tax=Toxoplasma gondii TaxID=5811 RepID=S8F1A9_TOXGM|nr:DnaJ domain-containing protein [Toxoplasma gondii ME49]EPT29471.1 DnaJ domain-containing protein [Toxoplasma gondii ME49]|eukprot:XP_018637060.1 DnaJ domain-containing protein [Toxoplasma gondii ME49]
MEGNKDEALRCLQLARRALESQDFAKALRMAERAQRMFPTSEGGTYVSICSSKLKESSQSSEPRFRSGSSSQGAREAARAAPPEVPSTSAGKANENGSEGASSRLHREGTSPARRRTSYSSAYSSSHVKPESADPDNSSSPGARMHATHATHAQPKVAASFSSRSQSSSSFSSSERAESTLPRSSSTPAAASSRGNYTAEQVALCTRVLTTKCYYQTLGVDRGATDEVIKKAYKKLALQLHPDKNRAPHAEEAFKKVSKVSQCLLDPEKRSRYDQHGEEEAANGGTRVRYRQEEGITPEELFQAFFGFTMGDPGRGRGQTRYYYQRRPQRGNGEEHGGGLYYLLQILPMAIMFLIMFVGNFFPHSGTQPTAPYSFLQTSDYPVHRLTRYHSVRFYVSPYFRRDYPDESEKLRDLEMAIELKFYHSKCQKEKEDLSRQLNVAHYYRASEAKVREILDRPRPHCQIYDSLWSQRTRRS